MCSSQNNFVVRTHPQQCVNLEVYHNWNLGLCLIVLFEDLVQGTGFPL